jgi:hypothetical protein
MEITTPSTNRFRKELCVSMPKAVLTRLSLNIPVTNNKESPGRKNPANNPVSANTANTINHNPPLSIYHCGCNNWVQWNNKMKSGINKKLAMEMTIIFL